MKNKKPDPGSAHKHKMVRSYTRGFDHIGFRCKCGYDEELKVTPAQRRRIVRDHKRSEARIAAMHGINWKFGKAFMTDQGRWKYRGYDLMERIRKWAKKYPKDVIVCGIDDSYNASSDLVFVLHRVGRKLWGTSCYTITQCDGQSPNAWFMYPSHREGIQKALQVMATHNDF